MNEWLNIKLNVNSRKPIVSFKVSFNNVSNKQQEFKFNNRNYKAESLGLNIKDENLIDIMPKKIMTLTPLHKDQDKFFIDAGKSWDFSFEGYCHDGRLTFTTVYYPIVHNKEYHVLFKYMNIESESIIIKF